MRIPLDEYVRVNDITPIQEYLENLIFSNVSEAQIGAASEENVAKLVRIYQYLLEFCLFNQQKLDDENRELEDRCYAYENDNSLYSKTIEDLKDRVNSLRKDLKQKEMIIGTYKKLIDEYKETASRKSKLTLTCKFCSGKTFKSEEKWQEHMLNRHYSKNKQVGANIDDLMGKFKQIKETFTKFVTEKHTIDMKFLSENNSAIKKKIEEIEHNREKEEAMIEAKVKAILLEMRSSLEFNSNRSDVLV